MKRIARFTQALSALDDYFVSVVATGTISFYLSLYFGFTINVSLAIWLLLSIVGIGLLNFTPRRIARPRQQTAGNAPPLVISFVFACVAILLASTLFSGRNFTLSWLAIYGSISISCALGCFGWGLTRKVSESTEHREPHNSRDETNFTIATAILCSVLSLVITRPDLDDVYLVNKTTYIAERGGHYTLRDTIFSDQIFPDQRISFPRTSIESLLGAAAHITGMQGPSIVYLVFGPIAAFTAVISLANLIRSLQLQRPNRVLGMTILFLVFNGELHASFGNMSFGRIWQGKVVFLVVVIPAIYRHSIDFLARKSFQSLLLLLLSIICGAGLTTTGVVVGPLVALVGTSVALLSKFPQLVPAFYVVVFGTVFTIFLIGIWTGVAGNSSSATVVNLVTNSSDVAVNPYGLWSKVLGLGWVSMLPAISVILAWILARNVLAKSFFSVVPLAGFGVLYFPGVLTTLNDLAPGGASIMWRLIWIVPIPLFVGFLLENLTSKIHSRVGRASHILIVPLALVPLLAFDSPVLQASNRGVEIGWPRWKLDEADLTASKVLIELSKPGDVVSAPVSISAAVAIRTTKVVATNAHPGYVHYLRTVPEGQGSERIHLWGYLEGWELPSRASELAFLLDVLSVSTACQPQTNANPLISVGFQDAGFKVALSDTHCTYWIRVP